MRSIRSYFSILAFILFGVTIQISVSTTVWAEPPNYFEQFRAEFQRNKVTVIASGLHLSPDEAGKFWPIYAEYEDARQPIVDRRLALLKSYGDNLDSMTDAKAAELLSASFAVRKDLLNLQEQYAEKFKEALSPIVAARFFQLEQMVQLIVDSQIAAEVPLIEKGMVVKPVVLHRKSKK